MKRREEIEKTAHKKYPYEGGTKGLICENSIPIFIQGAEWADKTMIDKACQWLKENLPYIVCKINASEYWLGKRDFIETFRKEMEE